jgi:hypothetical protein
MAYRRILDMLKLNHLWKTLVFYKRSCGGDARERRRTWKD